MHVPAAKETQCLKQILDPFALVDAPDEEEFQLRAWSRPALHIRLESGRIDPIRYDTDGGPCRPILNQGLSRKRRGDQVVRSHRGFADQMLEVLFGKRQLPLLLQRLCAVRICFKLLRKDPADTYRVRVQLKQNRRPQIMGEGVVSVVAIAEQAGRSLGGIFAGSASQRGIRIARDLAARGERGLRKLVEEQRQRAGKEALTNLGGG